MKQSIAIGLWVILACLTIGCNKEFGITGISPVSGTLAGGEPVTIQGSGFDSKMGISIYFGTEKAGNVVVNSPEKMTVTTPSSPEAQHVDVRIATDSGEEFVMRRAFRYIKKAHMDIRDLGKRKSMREKQQ